jgi:hypothetical protein
MTDQPTKWVQITKADEEVLFSISLPVSSVHFTGHDRKANAALFLRAQRMDELVEAVGARVSV